MNSSKETAAPSITGTWSCGDGYTYHIYQHESREPSHGIFVSLYSMLNGKVTNVGVGTRVDNYLRFTWADTPETNLNYNGTCSSEIIDYDDIKKLHGSTLNRSIGTFKRIKLDR